MRKKLTWRVSASLILSLACLAAGGGEQTSNGAEQTLENSRKNIQVELQSLKDHPWAGEYYEGDGLGVNKRLYLAPGSGFVFEWRGCLGVYDRNFGAVTTTNGIIHLSFVFTNRQEGFRGIEPAFFVVRWGDRRYLIPTNDVVEFCNSVNLGWESRDSVRGFHLLRNGDEKIKVDGFPDLPAGYERYLLKEPILAKIIAVEPHSFRPSVVEWKFKDTPVVLDVGMKQGLLPGMKLLATGERWESLVITKAEENRSHGVITQTEGEPGPEPGWVFSTRAQWRQAPP